MAKRCIGIDFSSADLCAIQLSRTDSRFHIEKIFSAQANSNTVLTSDILDSLITQHGFDRHADVAISMPHNAVFFQNLETDSLGLEQIRSSTETALEHEFPIKPDDFASQLCNYQKVSDGKYSVVATATKRKSLQDASDIITAARMKPALIEAPVFAIYATAMTNHPEIKTGKSIILYIDEHRLILALIQDSNILTVRNIPLFIRPDDNIDLVHLQLGRLLTQEIQITWQKIFAGEFDRSTQIYIAIGSSINENLKTIVEEKLNCPTTIVDPYANVKNCSGHEASRQICIAEGLALRALAPDQTEGVNFLNTTTGDSEKQLNLKKELVTWTVLVASIAVVSLVGLFARLLNLETQYKNIQNQTRQVFQSILPQEKNIVRPLAQLEQKLQNFRKDHQLFASFSQTGLSPLEVLRTLTLNTPAQANIKFDDLLVTAESVRLSGTCNSFESIYQWQRSLQQLPGFSSVDVQDVQKEPQSGNVSFTMYLSLAKQEQK